MPAPAERKYDLLSGIGSKKLWKKPNKYYIIMLQKYESIKELSQEDKNVGN